MTGTIGILNVGAGDTKLVFDPANPQECIRAARIVKDMIRRGYALLIAVEKDGETTYHRALDFREDTHEYIIADFDPVTAEKADKEEEANAGAAEPIETVTPPAPKRRGRGRRALPAGRTSGVAVARSAGG